jgi:hypothetical protein
MSRKCVACGGSLTLGYDGEVSCLMCGRSPQPARVSLRDALACLGEPDAVPGIGPRQRVPVAVSLERARRWGRGETAP